MDLTAIEENIKRHLGTSWSQNPKCNKLGFEFLGFACGLNLNK